jgi:hypothetical protein
MNRYSAAAKTRCEPLEAIDGTGLAAVKNSCLAGIPL